MTSMDIQGAQGQNGVDNSRTNLIINYLPQTLTDEEFRSMFLAIGPVKSARVIRDRATNYSYGFGFVDYLNEEDAERAIQTLNGLQLQNKRIKVAYARPGGEMIKGANLYVRNLPPNWRENELNDHFHDYGCIVQSRVLVDPQGNSKRVGFVLYDKRSEAENAITQLSGKAPPGQPDILMIKFADDNSKKVRAPPVQQYMHNMRFPGVGPMRNPNNRFRYNPMTGNNFGAMSNGGLQQGGGFVLFVYNIGYSADEKTLWQLFAPYGTVQKVNVMYDHQKNQCKGYGFVTMTNFQEAQNAINCLNGYFFNGRPLQVSFKN